MLGANFSRFGSLNGVTASTVSVDTKRSKVVLPIVGGYPAAVAAGLLSPQLTALVGHATGASPGTSLAETADCGDLRALTNQVKALSGKKLTTEQADTLLAEARQIAAILGC